MSFAEVLPVDLLLLCGIFGNVPDEDIRRTVRPCRSSSRRAARDLDARPAGRARPPSCGARVVPEAGLTEVAYDEEPEGYGVGVGEMGDASPREGTIPDPLFTFAR